MSNTATLRRDGFSPKQSVAEYGLLRHSRVTSLLRRAMLRQRRAEAIAVGLVFMWACILPRGVASADESTPVIVVLPPRFVSGGGDEATAAAELACDRLARELEKSPSLRVVDRAQLDRILKEHRLGPGPAGKIISYDVMARLELDAVRPVPRACLKLVDLSDGNLLAEAEFSWSTPLPDGAILDMAKMCLPVARDVAGLRPKALRVRLLEVENAGKSARLEPLAGRLRETFAGALGRSKGVRLVHHLEAQTAKEEALLLTMGLSQLPGGRQFVPQSDATVELRIRELDGVGKSFEQTQVEVAWRVRKGQQYSGDWATAAAAVKDFDGLLKTAWARCADTLGQASPQAAADYLDEMALRRKQAQAELDAAPKAVDPTRQQWRSSLAHVAAAAKLDPTWEEAAYALVFATGNASREGLDRDPDALEAGIREALRYIQRFQTDRKRRTIVADKAMFWALNRFLLLRGFEEVEDIDANGRLALDALKEIIDVFIAGPPEELPHLLPQAMHIVYRGMTLTGVDIAERRRWLDQVVRKGGRNVSLATHSPEVHEKTVLDSKMRFRMHAARLLAEEGDPKAARPYIEELIPLMLAAKQNTNDYIAEQARLCIEKMNDTDLLAKLNAAVTNMVYVTRINWLNFHPLGAMPPTGPRPRVNVQAMRYDKFTGASPLVACGGRMYCIVPGEGPKDKPRVGFVKLDAQGRPDGKIRLMARQPATDGLSEVLSKTVSNDKLYLGTRAGLLEYDPGKDAWRMFGPEQGLPEWNVYTVVALDDGTLFCHGGDRLKQGFFCQVNPSTAEIKLLRRLAHTKGRNPLVDSGLSPVWRTGDRITGFLGGSSLFTLPKFGADEPVYRRWPDQNAPGEYYKSLPDGMAVIAGRRFVMCRDFFREIDDDGKVLHTWPRSRYETITRGPSELPGQAVAIPGDEPDLVYQSDYRNVAQDSSHIFFLSDRILCFDPQSGAWYGPLETEPWTSGPGLVASGQNGVWFSCDRDLVYVHTADFIAAARQADRVVSSDEFRRKRAAFIRSSPPLERAKWAMSVREWDKVRDLCAGVLERDAKNVEALLIMGLLHEPCCLNQPDKALEYYGKLAAIEENPPAAFTGLIHQYRLHIEAKRYAEALRVDKVIQERYPRNALSETLGRYNRWLAQKSEESEGGAR